MICLSSGITEINLSTLNILNSLRTKKLELFGIGMSDTATINVSNTFHPLFKKSDFFGSPINLIKISITKKTVIP